ncbi:hypothetical protein ACQ5SK_25495 [Bradyrhizobium japonicum]
MVLTGCVNRVVMGDGKALLTSTAIRAARQIVLRLIRADASERFPPISLTVFCSS